MEHPEAPQVPQIPPYIRITSTVLCAVIMCLGVVGNAMVAAVILRSKDMRNSTNIFLVNLSVADLMVLLVCTPTVLVEVNTRPETWALGREMCLAVPFVELTVAHASVLTILAISFERYYAICEPLKAGYVCTKTRATFICFAAWFAAAALTSPILAVAEYRLEEYHDGSTVPVCLTQADDFWPSLYFLMTVSLFFLVPFLVLAVLYAVIARRLMSEAAGGARARRRRAALTLATVALSFFLCLTPFKLLTLWIVASPDGAVSRLGVDKYYALLYFSRTMLYLNSAANPVLYNLTSSKFSPILAVAEYRTEEYYDGSPAPVCLTEADTFWPALYFFLTTSLFFAVPFAVLAVLYALIARSLVADVGRHGRDGPLRYRRQAVAMLAAVVLSFFVCLLPFKALTLWIVLVPPEAVTDLGVDGYYALLYFSRVMLYLNSAVNPVLYNLMSSKFREGFLRLLRPDRRRRGRGTFNTATVKSTTTTTTTTATTTAIPKSKAETFV